jgi:hypothetical protein
MELVLAKSGGNQAVFVLTHHSSTGVALWLEDEVGQIVLANRLQSTTVQ